MRSLRHLHQAPLSLMNCCMTVLLNTVQRSFPSLYVAYLVTFVLLLSHLKLDIISTVNIFSFYFTKTVA